MSRQSKPKVSVIVPVYNTELYVERAIVSLMEQTIDDVQFIIIDDGSKDNSLSIIKQVIARYPARQDQVILISRENCGVAATRAQGMELATGDYVIHFDSDDWAELNWLEAMYIKAIEDNADVVVCDFFEKYSHVSIYKSQEIGLDRETCLRNLFLGKIANSSCNKLVARKLLSDNGINFHSGYDMGEDFFVTFLVFLKARRVVHLKEPFYMYNKENESSLTNNYSSKALDDLLLIVDLAEKKLDCHGLYNSVEREFNFFKIGVVSTLISNSTYNVDKVKYAFGLYPASNKMIFSSSMRMLKLVYFLYKTGMLFLLKYIAFIKKFHVC